MKVKALILDGRLAAFWVQREHGGPVEHWHFATDGAVDSLNVLSHAVDPADSSWIPKFGAVERRSGAADRRASNSRITDTAGRRSFGVGRRSEDRPR